MVEQGLVELLQRLVGVPSVNPAVCDNPALAGEARMADLLESLLAEKGFETSRDEAVPGRPNVIGQLGPDDAPHTLAIEGHLDTVSIDGMVVEPFAGDCRSGRLYGRGACDMKGPMAAALWALNPDRLKRWSEAGLRLLFVGAIDEETGLRGALSLTEREKFRTDELIVLEPTELKIVYAHKGALWYEAEVTGRPGHGSAPELGLSAIQGMTALMERIEQEARDAATCHGDESLGYPTVNVGRIEGGSGVNIVPGSCRVEVDRRLVEGEDPGEIIARVSRELDALKTEGAILDGSVRVIGSSTAYCTALDSALVQRLSAVEEEMGIPAVTMGTGWCSDAGPLSKLSGATVVFGPGSIAQAHTEDEYIELDELQAGADILGQFLDRTIAEKGKGS